MSAFDAYVQAKFHGGTMAGGPVFTVVHDAETPLRAGYADSITEFFRVGPTAGTSAHAMVDPVKANKLLPDNVVAWAAGPKANPRGWHLEQAGYARFTRAEWTTADGMAQMRRAGACLREVHDQWGIPKRWCTDDQLRRAALGDRASGGMTTHQQVARVLGGTTHSDPETNYPRDLLLEIVLGSTEEFTVAQYDDLVTLIKDNHQSMARLNYGILAETRATNATLRGGMPEGQNNFHWLAQQIASAVASIPGAQVDQQTLDAAIRESMDKMGPVDVKALADELQDEADRRARDGDSATGPRT